MCLAVREPCCKRVSQLEGHAVRGPDCLKGLVARGPLKKGEVLPLLSL